MNKKQVICTKMSNVKLALVSSVDWWSLNIFAGDKVVLGLKKFEKHWCGGWGGWCGIIGVEWRCDT